MTRTARNAPWQRLCARDAASPLLPIGVETHLRLLLCAVGGLVGTRNAQLRGARRCCCHPTRYLASPSPTLLYFARGTRLVEYVRASGDGGALVLW